MFLQKAIIYSLAALVLIAPAQSAERTTYLVPDAAGSPVAAMSEQGEIVWRKSYKPYGEETSPPAGSPNPSYTGKPLDAESGLVYMGARMYDPEAARFTGIDPRGFDENNIQSFGRYIYANNSPYVYNDPNGEVALPIILGVGAFLLFTSLNANAPEDYGTPTPAFGVDGLGVGVVAGGGAYAIGEGVIAAAAIAAKAYRETAKHKGLGNPFRGKSPEEIDSMLRKKGYEPRGPDPVAGKGGYVNPKTERSYHIDPEPQVFKKGVEQPHVDVNRPRDYKGALEKKKYPLE